ncbi:thrombospondin type-1 domain-containing protein 4-like [Achroia grisella]|uniref:thrombospondin type-1 domain-containing protein 4-like n=1 Tax=Achroia grisella TaxID=688607 RepID=UPI0027D3379E|nr:thrombospondin type-1 domain-containing protein 4-like [Achroia grisella]XP_059060916.1 thrombospondin type-1 domain-containing protein 4-like [Achroia grisella]
MEKKKHSFWKKIIWIAAIIEFAMVTRATNTTTLPPQVTEGNQSEGYVWSTWGTWSRCSRTCGGGVAVQERQCLPRTKSTASNTTLAPPVITIRVARETQADCLGVAKRYHECNTAPCSGSVSDMRSEQCSTYDRRPFRGRFYTWVPYIDGDSPCTLNCRPLGQHFYASLALVADGTPCTRPGFRAICVQGVCKVVGRESVLAAVGAVDVRCGRRLVSGLFNRPRLPLGYNYVTTVPRGACRLNVTEILPTENYIALKISNGSYIMNGEFAVSRPGTYDAAGTRFFYTRAIGLDSVFAQGPTLHPIDIMILYTQPNPSIKYEYYIEAKPGDIDIEVVTQVNLPDIVPSIHTKHSRRHHSFEHSRPNFSRYPDLTSMSQEEDDDIQENIVGTRKFIWKILTFTQCSRTCGGGLQLGKYRCVETTSGTDREVSSVHCSGPTPAGRRRRCGNVPCEPRWRAAAWSTCPKCGPAVRTRIVGCVQDHWRGITKVSDTKCNSRKPPITEPCNIPDCIPPTTGITLGGRSAISPRENTDTFRDGPVYTVAANSTDIDIGPLYTFSAPAGWLYTEWTECVGWCVGGGVQTRGIRCADPSGCEPRKAPEASRSCTPKLTCESHDAQWFTGEWSPCSSSCKGKQVRGVLCISGNGRHLRDIACKAPKPENERDCGDSCSATWYFSDWGQCTSNCTVEIGVQKRSVVCTRDIRQGDNGTDASNESECKSHKPDAQRECTPRCPTVTVTTSSSDISLMSQRNPDSETTTTLRTFTREVSKECEDKLYNCVLAVQARLCHYNYYIQNCCNSCTGR